VKRFRGLEGPARLFVVLACCGALADLASLVTGVRRYVYDDAAWMPVDTAQVAFLLATAVSYLVWFHRAYTNLPRLGVPDPFVPARLHDDLWRASDPDLPWPAARGSWATDPAPVPVTHLLWWPAAIAGAIAGIVPAGALVPAAGDLLRIVAAALAMSIVLAVTARQRARAYRAPWTAPR
jgi:hypothetical protein